MHQNNTSTEFKRVKHGQLPGDVHKSEKIAMREKLTPKPLPYPGTLLTWTRRSKRYRKDLVLKSKSVQRQRDKKASSDEL